jgi:hypothetical protein
MRHGHPDRMYWSRRLSGGRVPEQRTALHRVLYVVSTQEAENLHGARIKGVKGSESRRCENEAEVRAKVWQGI